MSAVVLLSGGLDSMVLLAQEVAARTPVVCVSFGYGQRHRRELNAASQIAAFYGAPRIRLDLPQLIFLGSALTGSGDVPSGRHYTDPSQATTVVPNRNPVFLSVAASIAVQHECDRVLFAAHAGDAAIYPDCRPEFVASVDAAMRLACGVGVVAPFLELTKRDVVALGRNLGVPFEMSWSCYLGRELPCGTCGACIEREEALA